MQQWSVSRRETTFIFRDSAMQNIMESLPSSNVYLPTKTPENFALRSDLTKRLQLDLISAVRYLLSLRTWCAHVIAAATPVHLRCSIVADARMRHIATQNVNEAIGNDTKSTAAE
jgi:hypothetical protein